MTKDKFLKYKKPEETGVSSESITNFLLALDEHEINAHGYVLMKDGAVISEGYYKPYDEKTLHRIYSMSKSFTALAIGLLQDEGKLDIHDPIVKYFPEYNQKDVDPYMAKATIRELMMMSSPQSYTTYTGEMDDWIPSFFNTKPSHPAGTIFSYDTSASDVLAALVDKLSGKPMLEYMKDRMLREMGFSEDAFAIQTPDGFTSGGSGICCTPRDLARVGQLLLDGGRWKGKQLLSEAYVKEATSKQISNNFTWRVDDPSAGYGYGYFIWRLWHNSYSFLGMGEQFVTVIPDKNMVFAATMDNQYSGGCCGLILELLWKHLIDHVQDGPVPTDPAEVDTLKNIVSNLSLLVPDGESTSPWKKKINHVKYIIEKPNQMGIKSFWFDFNGSEGVFRYDTERGMKELKFGCGHNVVGELMEPQLFGKAFRKPANRNYRVVTSAVWPQPSHLFLRMGTMDDHIGNANMQFSFSDDGRVSLYFVHQMEYVLSEYDGIAMGHRE